MPTGHRITGANAMSETRGMFISYCACGAGYSAAYIDSAACTTSIGELLTEAVRDGRKVQ